MATTAQYPAASVRVTRAWTWMRVRNLLARALAYTILSVGAFVVCVPWIWMVLTSLKTPGDILRIPLTVFPTNWMWKNYVDVFAVGSRPMWKYVANTLQIVVFAEIGVLLSNAIVAFSFARLRWRYRDVMFIVVLATMMLPAQVTMIPIFALFTNVLDWRNTYLPLTVPYFFGSAWAIFLLRQYMMTIPAELDDAARIDGCSTVQLFARIIVPLAAPVLAVLAIFTFNGVWNDFFGPLLYIEKVTMFTVAQWLAGFTIVTGPGQMPRYDLLMAASVLSSLPMAILFFIFQRQFIQGVVITGVKG
ncbi:MAG: carbohydrate ABC transporter permease [Anaerolineae bacterium]|nr:carbohydrate ABC transporter permease [Anaerolineae bacterium]